MTAWNSKWHQGWKPCGISNNSEAGRIPTAVKITMTFLFDCQEKKSQYA